MKNRANKSQHGQAVPDLSEDDARAYFEKLRWPNGPICPHCGSVEVYHLGGEATRPGLLKCRDCKGQFTVTVNTIMEDSHLPLAVWVKAFHYMTSSKKGMSALQLQRNLGLGSYRTAWHLAHRIRYAMKEDGTPGMLKGVVEGNETYVGGKPRPGGPSRKKGRGTSKTPVVVLVSREGKAQSQPIPTVSAASLREALKSVDENAMVYTDELPAWAKAVRGDFFHEKINHGKGEYARGDVHTNTAESYFALLKRGVYGTFHHVSKQHLHRYCAKFDFRWNGRELMDSERRDAAVQQIEGKRLMYRMPVGEA